MPRLTLLLFAVVAILGFGLAYLVIRPIQPGMTEMQVRSMIDAALAQEPAPLTDDTVRSLVAAALAEREPAPQSHAPLDADVLNPMIEDYLLSNPRILQRVSVALDQEIRSAERERAQAVIAANHERIFEDPDHIVIGNPDGDVTLVEMFDYNCGYCRQALPDLATLVAEDPNLKVVLKEFPILSEESADAARVAVLVARAGVDYWQFHQKLFTNRGRVNGQTALDAARELGLNPVELELEMRTPAVTAVIDKSYSIASALNISGTPTFIIGDEIIAGAVGIEQLRLRIANMRACGQTVCEPEAVPGGNS
jgi:protein-disulfide isomerase